MAYDPYYDHVTLLLPLDGSNGGTTFTDYSPNVKTVTRGAIPGNVSISTAQYKFGGASAYFDGTSPNYLLPSDSVDFDLPGDFTYEMWVRPSSLTGTHQLIFINASINYILYLSNDKLALSWGSGKVGSTSLGVDTWHHVALTRESGVVKMWLDGVQQSTNTNNTDSILSTNTFVSADANSFAGYIDDVRFTKGVARYTTTFTPPTEAFPTSGPPAFSITSIVPAVGTTSGGTPVTITGIGFEPSATAAIDGNNLTSLTVVDSTTITGLTPAGTAGEVDVTVTNP